MEIAKNDLTTSRTCVILTVENRKKERSKIVMSKNTVVEKSEMLTTAPFLHPESAVRGYLKDCGVRSVNSQRELKLNPKLFPAISYNKPNDLFVLYFQLPQRLGEQSFFFDETSPLFFGDDKIENSSNNNYSPFFVYDSKSGNGSKSKSSANGVYDEPLFSELLSYHNDLLFAPFSKQRDFCLAVIKRFFSITPTVLNTARHQNKKKHRRLYLQPKPATVKNALGVINNNASVAASGNSVDPENAAPTTSRPRRQPHLPDFADYYVQKAAQDYDLNWFNPFWNEYARISPRNAAKKRERDKIEKLFRDRVLSLQGRKEGV